MRPTVPEPVNGLVLLDKQPGQTSFQALYPVKRLYGNAVGHTGTLDRFAEGLLVVLVGKFTKFNPLFTAFDKVYEADFTFGVETDTLDPEGAVVLEGGVPDDSVLGWTNRWVGPQLQIPPDYSAVHVNGQRASDRKRHGQSLELTPRLITIHSLDVLSWKSPILTVRIHCSKGTYVRSIARDWGRLAGFGAHVTRLRRTRVGPFELPTEPLELKTSRWSFDQLDIPVVSLSPEVIPSVLNGRPVEPLVPGLANLTVDRVALEAPDGKLVAVLERKERWKYLFVDRGPNS